MLKVQNTDKSKKDIVIADGQASTQSQKENVDSNVDNDDMTVEEYLELRCQQMVQEFRAHIASLVAGLRKEYQVGAESLVLLMNQTIAQSRDSALCIQLKCIAGAHMGQKFRLEASGDESEDVFKIGRSTGRVFKEKGVSVYKDKEISTTHSKIEVKSAQAFYVDLRSTNGSLINGKECEALLPYRLKTGDIITMGVTQLEVMIQELNLSELDVAYDSDPKEDFASV